VQVRSVVDVPDCVMYWPAEQAFQGVQLVAVLDALVKPLVQVEQTRSVVEVPAVETYWPAGQLDQEVQLVAVLFAAV